jgi:hypothetical protein
MLTYRLPFYQDYSHYNIYYLHDKVYESSHGLTDLLVVICVIALLLHSRRSRGLGKMSLHCRLDYYYCGCIARYRNVRQGKQSEGGLVLNEKYLSNFGCEGEY